MAALAIRYGLTEEFALTLSNTVCTALRIFERGIVPFLLLTVFNTTLRVAMPKFTIVQTFYS